MANESGGQDLREVWQAQPELEPRMTACEIRTMITSMDGAWAVGRVHSERCRDRAVVAGGGVVCSSFRLLASIGVGTALWIL